MAGAKTDEDLLTKRSEGKAFKNKGCNTPRSIFRANELKDLIIKEPLIFGLKHLKQEAFLFNMTEKFPAYARKRVKVMKTDKFLVTILTMFIAAAVLSACDPVYKSEYQYITPPTPQGQVCANHCLDVLYSCTDYCQVKERECRRTAARNAEAKYFLYLARQKAEGKEPEMDQEDFFDDSHCGNTWCQSECESGRYICHVNCGGQVQNTRVCTAFCD